MMRRAAIAAAYLVPVAVCLAVYWPALDCWFQQDDFAWLGLRMGVYDFNSLMRALFEPMAQGTIRPWSERGFFMLFSALFGLDALPYKIFVFATQILNLFLLARLALELEQRYIAAFCAPLLWGVNVALGPPLAWASAYNEVMCAAFLLGATLLFIRYTKTSDRRFYAAQFAIFVLGFGALELNVAFPVIAAAYALCYAPRFILSTAPMALVSAGYAALHSHFAPKMQSGPYAMHVDASMLQTFFTYWRMALASAKSGIWIWITLGLALFVVIRLIKHDRTVLFPLAWYFALLAPMLPLRDHITDYYLTLSTIGLSLLGACALNAGWNLGGLPRLMALTLAGAYLWHSVPAARAVADWNRDRSNHVRDLVLGVETAHEKHPGKTILLSGVGTDMFWAAVYDKPFRLFGAHYVYLTPESESAIEAHPELGSVAEFVFPPGQTLRMIERGDAVVYAAGSAPLRNITSVYRSLAAERWKPELARLINAGNPAFADQFGEGWYPVENGYRWMARAATLWLPRSDKPNQMLYVSGYCPASQLTHGPVRLTIVSGGKVYGSLSIAKPDAFEGTFSLKLAGIAGERLEIGLEVDRVYTPPGDGRPLGLAFGTFLLRD